MSGDGHTYGGSEAVSGKENHGVQMLEAPDGRLESSSAWAKDERIIGNGTEQMDIPALGSEGLGSTLYTSLKWMRVKWPGEFILDTNRWSHLRYFPPSERMT